MTNAVSTISESHMTLGQRIDQIIDLVPTDFSKRESLVKALEGRKTSIRYTAPEAISGRWQEVSQILSSHLGDVEAPWADEIGKIFGAE